MKEYKSKKQHQRIFFFTHAQIHLKSERNLIDPHPSSINNQCTRQEKIKVDISECSLSSNFNGSHLHDVLLALARCDGDDDRRHLSRKRRRGAAGGLVNSDWIPMKRKKFTKLPSHRIEHSQFQNAQIRDNPRPRARRKVQLVDRRVRRLRRAMRRMFHRKTGTMNGKKGKFRRNLVRRSPPKPNALPIKTGGLYMPPAKLRLLQVRISSLSPFEWSIPCF